MASKLIEGIFVEDRIITDDSDLTRELYNKSRLGEPMAGKRFQYTLVEGLYLLEKNKMSIKSGRKSLDYESYLKKARRLDKNFLIRYTVFRDMRNRGYIVKTSLRFGADFRVYDRGIKPGEDHAKWLLYPISEVESISWFDFVAKNRVAHSTRKRLLIGIVDDELSVTYYEIAWTKP
ncbi:tRNA-intron lyase [Candidatus Woesearchaeota archaeon]|nr:MAG: tRNA-intron lyase [Candidatus Woesearchaeota archaeon]